MNINDYFILSDIEKDIINLIAEKRQLNKEKSNLDGKGQANNKKGIRNNKLGFAGEFLFCKGFNLFPDFTINNTSKIKETDNGDAILKGFTVDVKTSQNQMLFNKNNFIFKKNVNYLTVDSYVLETNKLLNFNQIIL
jgi:hypothetical protein